MRWFAINIRTFPPRPRPWRLAVWVSAVTAADPNEVRTYPNPIPLEIIGQDPSLVLTSEIPSSVEVSLRAPRSVWESLTTQENAVRAILDLSGLSAGEHDIGDPDSSIRSDLMQIVLANPTTVTVDLEPLASQTFPLVSR